jgi:hypothetical protein
VSSSARVTRSRASLFIVVVVVIIVVSAAISVIIIVIKTRVRTAECFIRVARAASSCAAWSRSAAHLGQGRGRLRGRRTLRRPRGVPEPLARGQAA